MRAAGFFGLVTGLTMFGIATVEAAPAFPPGAEAREAQLIAKLNPQARAWLKQEAMREAASNIASDAVATQAVRSAGPGLNLAGMSIEDAVMLVMMIVSRDADEDMRRMLTEMENARRQKQAMRQTIQNQKAAQASVNSQLRQEYAAQQARPKIARSAALDAYLTGQNVSYDSLSDMSQEQQLKLQMALDRRTKALQTLSNILKKTSDTSQGIIQNLK
jgi:hypothetical protein